MSETEAILIFIASIVGLLVVIGGLVWGISAYARAQRRTRIGRTEEYLPPPPPLSTRQGTLGTEEYPRIRWGNVTESSFSERNVERVHFSDMEQTEEYDYKETPYSNTLIVKCPVCKNQIDQRENNAITCPNPKCQESFHQHCWEHMNSKCPICG